MAKGKEILYEDVKFTYTLTNVSEKKKNEYEKVLNVYIIDPSNGKRMRKAAKKKNNEQLGDDKGSNKEIDIVKSHYFKVGESYSDKKCKNIAEKLAKSLFCEYKQTLYKKLKKEPSASKLDAFRMHNRYIDGYIESGKKCTKATNKEKRRIIKKACEFLSPKKEFVDLSDSDFDKLFKVKEFIRHKNLLLSFFDYCKKEKAYAGENPLREYLDTNYVGSKSNEKNPYPKEAIHLSLDIEKKFHKVMLNHIDDKEFMVLVLAKCMRLSLPEIRNLKWKSIVIIDEHVIIHCEKDNKSNFHNFTRPVMLEGSELIKIKRQRMIEKFGSSEELDKQFVIPIRTRKGSKFSKDGDITKHLRDYIRMCLKEAGLGAKEINNAAPGTRDKGGSGIKLLHNHYDFVLCERCGVALDTPDGNFLRGLEPGDILNMFYRSMSDKVSGIPYFITIMKRDDLVYEEDENVVTSPCVVKRETDDKIIYTFHKPGKGNRINIVIPSQHIIKGSMITIRSNNGITGIIKHNEINSKSISKKIY